MAAITPAKLYQMARADDPKEAILDALGDALREIKTYGRLILVGTYIAPEVVSTVKRADGSKVQLFRADANKAEDLWLGNMGLVLQKGPLAFEDDEFVKFGGMDVNIHDWVVFRFSSAWEFHLNGVSVRSVEDREIRHAVTNPNLIASKPPIGLE